MEEQNQRLSEAEKCIQTTTEAWQNAVTRASEAEKQAREFEKTVSSLREQLHVNKLHKQLWAPQRSDIPTLQIAGNPSANLNSDESMENDDADQVHKQLYLPPTEAAGNSSADPTNDEPMESDHNDAEMEVDRTFNCYTYYTSLSVHRDCLAIIGVLPFPNPCDFVDLKGGEIQNQVLDQGKWNNLILKYWLVYYIVN